MITIDKDGLKIQPCAKWVRKYSRPNVYADLFWHCSGCDFKTLSMNADKYYHYCPNCGAWMDTEGRVNGRDTIDEGNG